MLQIYCLCLLAFCTFTAVKSNIKCRKETDCYKNKESRCSFCVDDNSKKSGHCIFPYPDVFISDTNCIKLTTPKCKDNCKGRGSCDTNSILNKYYYYPHCYCEKNYYSVNCDKISRDGQKVISYFKWRFNEQIEASKETTLEFIASSVVSGTIKAAQFFLKVDDDDYQETLPYKLTTESKRKWGFYSKKVTFPYKLPTNTEVKRLGDILVGYESKFYVSWYDDGLLTYENHFPVFVIYDGAILKCVPVVSISNCGLTMAKSINYIRSSEILLESQVEFIDNGKSLAGSFSNPNCDTKSSLKLSWQLWKLISHKEIVYASPLYKNVTLKEVLFKPYSLDIGNYKISFEAASVMVGRDVSNYAQCYFHIACLPLVAVINGGSDRLIYKEKGLQLRAEESYDPNQPPNEQHDVFIEWSCVNILNPRDKPEMCNAKKLKVSQPYRISEKKLAYGAIYNFTLKVWTDRYAGNKYCENIIPKLTYLRIEVANDTAKPLHNILIKCVQNCRNKVLYNQELFLKAANFITENVDKFIWTYTKRGDTEQTTDDIKVNDIPSHLLIIKKNSLEPGVTYTVTVREEGSSIYAKYSFETDVNVYEGNCTIQPETGVKGKTLFNMGCFLPNSALYLFEFYDKSDEEANSDMVFSGRMLGSSMTGELKDVHLTRGNILVYIKNEYGLHMTKVLKVTLDEWNINVEILDTMKKNLTEERLNGNLPRILRYISFIPDVIPDSIEGGKISILNFLLSEMNQLNITNLGTMKLCTSTLSNVLMTLNKPTQLQLTSDLMLATMKIMFNQGKVFSNFIHTAEFTQMSPDELRQIAISILDSLVTALNCKDPKTLKAHEDDFDMITLYELRYASRFGAHALTCINTILSYLQSPGQPPSMIASQGNNIVLWVMESEAGYTIPEMLETNEDISVGFSNKLQNRLNKGLRHTDSIALQVGSLQQNLFWWSTSEISSNLMSVAISKQGKRALLYPIRNIDTPMDVIINMTSNLTRNIISSTTIQLDDKSEDRLYLDLGIAVHRLDPVPRSLVSLKFLFPETNAPLRVFAENDFRPDYQIMIDKSTLITEETPFYPIKINNNDEPAFVFVGILPGPDVPINQSVSYSFEVNTTLCQLWANGQWSSLGCKMGSKQGDSEVHCHCTHFSIFAAAFPVPPQEINPFSDAKLFLTVFKNPLVVVFVCTILLIYLLLSIWLWRLDKRANRKRTVIVLKDFFPNEKVPYLLAVYTSSRFNAGTSANVAIKIYGSDAASRVHIFTSEERKVLKRNSDDWFLICCPQHLGDLQSIHLWHDNTGCNPEWFCHKIYVYDITERTETLFFIDQWLALRLNDYPEAHIFAAAIEETSAIKNLFLDNCILGLRENHVLLGFLISHPRSGVTKLERLSVFMCCLMVSMLCSIMFYVPLDTEYSMDDFHYEIGSRDLYVGIQSLFISVLITCLVFIAFKKSYEYTYEKPSATSRHRGSTLSLSSYGSEGAAVPPPRGKSFYQNYVHLVTKVLKNHPLEPVQLPSSKPVLKIRKMWRITAWIACATVIGLSSYLVMLYGLRLGYEKSKSWLTTLLMSMGTEIFVFGPIRIIVIATLLALALKSMFDVDTHRVSMQDVKHVKIPESEEYIKSVVRKRCHEMYSPLTLDRKQEMLRKKEILSNWWTLIDFLFSLLLAVVLNTIVYKMWTSHYATNQHVMEVMTSFPHYRIGSVYFFNVTNEREMEDYMEYTFINALYNLRWYNGKKLLEDNGHTKEYWAADYTLKMLGLPQIRQLRIVPVTCKSLSNVTSKCSPPWRKQTEDNDDYGVGWRPALYKESKKKKSPWRYTDESSLLFTTYRLHGVSSTMYHNGGYMVNLGPTRQDTDVTLAELKENRWQDKRTRVVFVELTLYNVNKNLFTQVTLTVEYLISGLVLKNADAISADARMIIAYRSSIFFIFLIYYFARNAYLINRIGLLEYLSFLRNICRLLVVILSMFVLITFGAHYFSYLHYSEEFRRHGADNNYFDFDSFTYYYKLLQLVLSITLCVVIMHVIVLLRFGRSLLTHYYAFILSIDWIISLTCVFVILLIVLIQISYFSSFLLPVNYKNLIIFKNSMENISVNDLEYTHIKIFLIMKTVINGLIVSFFIILFLYYTKLARSYKLKKEDEFNFILFVLSRLKLLFKKSKH